MLSLVESPNTMMLVLRLALSLGLVLALVGAVTWVLRRRGLLAPGGAKRSTGRLEILDRKPLSKHASLVVARVGGVAVLVGVTEQQVAILSDAPGIDAAWAVEDEDDNAVLPVTTLLAESPLDTPAPGRPLPPADFPQATATATADGTIVAGSVLELERLMLLPSADSAGTDQIMETRRTGLRVDADAAITTSSGMSFVEALRELTVRRS